MKVLMINGSPRAKGTTAAALEVIARELKSQDVQVHYEIVGQTTAHGCVACGHCAKTGDHRCIFTDDDVNRIIELAEGMDGLILASPVHYGGICGGMKSFLDRFFYAGADIKGKVAASLVCLRRSGGVDALHSLNNYLHLADCLMVPTPYWSVVHGNRPEELAEDAEGLMLLKKIGQQMAWMLRMRQAGEAVAPPVEVPPARTDFVAK